MHVENLFLGKDHFLVLYCDFNAVNIPCMLISEFHMKKKGHSLTCTHAWVCMCVCGGGGVGCV